MLHGWPRIDEDYFELLHFVETFDYDFPSASSQNNILKLMVKSFKAESGQFCLHGSQQSNAHKEKTVLLNLSWRYTEQYINYYHTLDPFIQVMPDVGAFRNQDLMPPAKWRNCEFNADFIKPQKVQNLLVMRLLDSDRLIGHLGMFRSDSIPAFSQKDLYRAQYLASVFSQKLKQKQLVQKSKELDLLLNQLKAIPAVGVTVLDSYLHPVYSNLKMMDFEAFYTTPQNNGHTESQCPSLPAEVITKCQEIAASLRQAEQPHLENRHIVLWQAQHQKVDVEIVVLPVEQNSNARHKAFYLLLVFSKAVRSERSGNSKTMANFKLTPKETEITECLCQGLTNKEISQKLYISLPTVATHVQHILRKTGISRRSQLISNLLS